MRKEIVIPGLAAVCGGVGFFLRRWELSSAFEADTGLPIPFAPAAVALAVFSALAALVLLLLCRGKHSAFPGGYDQAFQAKGNTVYVTAMVLSGFVILAAGLLMAFSLPGTYQAAVASFQRTGGTNPVLAVLPRGLLAALCVLSCPGVIAVGRNNYRRAGRGKYAAALLLPAYAGCVWLIVAYQARAADPIRQDYVYELFAIIAALLAFYFTAGVSFERAKVGRTAFFSALGIYFSIVTLADGHALADALLYGFVILCLLTNLAVLLANDRRYRDAVPEEEPPAREPEGPRMPDGPEEAYDPLWAGFTEIDDTETEDQPDE